MIAFEIALLLFLGVLVVMGIRHIARPITEAYVEKMKFGYKALGSKAESTLTQKIRTLEAEVMNLKDQVKSLQESVDFAIEQKTVTKTDGETIKVKDKKHS